jgi:hypothetical protein
VEQHRGRVTRIVRRILLVGLRRRQVEGREQSLHLILFAEALEGA